MGAFVALGAATLPRAVVGREAGAFFDGDEAAQDGLAREVERYVKDGVQAASFHTGSARFDGEWALGTQQMTVLGLGQVILAHPELRGRYLPVMEACVEGMLAPHATAFGTEAWGARGLDALEGGRGHAYLGYVGLALGMLRRVAPETRFAAVHDRLSAALEKRLVEAPYALVETYPGEAYPCDVASIVGALGLHARLQRGADHGAALRRVSAVWRERWIDPASGLLYQAGDASRGVPVAPPRASGTALAAYFVSFADPALAGDLFAAVARSQRASFLGFGGVREYARGHEGGGDIDSGPVLFGVSVSATGFALAGARASGDRAFFAELYRTAALFGVPVDRGEGRRFATGGPLGNALLLAMLTAERRP
jgi:hypothetical protein